MQLVRSPDGTKIAYTKVGSGETVVLVGGALDDGAENAPLLEFLGERFTAVNYSRRGRGGSGDTAPHSLERELEDLAAVIDVSGGKAHLFGASSGGALALEAAAAGLDVASVAAYDVPYSVAPEAAAAWRSYVDNVRAAMARDDRDQAIELFMRVAGLPDEAIQGARHSPYWSGLVALAHTLPYDAACLPEGTPPEGRLGTIHQPVLLLTRVGQDALLAEGDFFHAAAHRLASVIPQARRGVIETDSHMVDAAAMAPTLIGFFGGSS